MTKIQADHVVEAPLCLDHCRSFFCGTSELNSVRFCIESRATITDSANEKIAVFYQCASCKNENAFGETNLVLAVNYDCMPILGHGRWLLFRRHTYMNAERYRETIESPNAWGETRHLTHKRASVQVLDTSEKILDATAQGLPLVLQTELVNDDASLTAVTESLVKTMNISPEKQMYQVDTGRFAFALASP